jgi:hypothetical protein
MRRQIGAEAVDLDGERRYLQLVALEWIRKATAGRPFPCVTGLRQRRAYSLR